MAVGWKAQEQGPDCQLAEAEAGGAYGNLSLLRGTQPACSPSKHQHSGLHCAILPGSWQSSAEEQGAPAHAWLG